MHDAERPLAEEVWRRAKGRRLLLLLDFDGTLCEFQADPQAVRLPESRRSILERLQQRATVGIVSGRRLADVRERCELNGLIVAGLHGLEIDGLGESYVHPDLDATGSAIAGIATGLRARAEGIPGVFVEDKGLSVALHFREAAPGDQRTAVELFTAVSAPFIESGRLRVMRGSFVLELLPNIDWNKGDAVRWITEHVCRREGETFVVYIGDDVTDQDAFAAVEGDGLPIAASDRVNAHTRLDGPAGVERFLAALIR